MATQTRLVWIGLIIAIAFGLSIEALKHTRFSSDGSSWRPRMFGMDDFDDSAEDALNPSHSRVKSNDQAKRARSRLLKGRIAGLSAATATLAPAAVAVVAPNPALSNLAAPVKVNTDEEAKKKKAAEDAKKKKKKKKAGAKTTPEETPAYSAPSTDSASNDKSKDVSGGSSMYGGGGGGTSTRTIIGGATAVNENPQTLQEWLVYILADPNYDRTMKLIQAQQQHLIDSEIFHTVIAAMFDDSRAKMHEYGVLALGSTPSLKSFILLEAVSMETADSSELRIQARTYLKTYSKIENLRYLASAITNSELEATTIYEALRLIQVAVANYKPSSSSPTVPTASANVTRQFTSLVSVLARVVATATDATVQQEATRTLQQVNSLVGTTTTPVATASM